MTGPADQPQDWTVTVDLQRVDAEMAASRIEMSRVDGKLSTLLSYAATVLSGGLAVLGSGRLAGAAEVAGWLAVGCLLAGVLVLGSVVWPSLRGGWGLMRWARTGTTAELAGLLSGDGSARRVEDLRQHTRAVRAKFVRVQAALVCLAAGMLAAIAAAALHSL